MAGLTLEPQCIDPSGAHSKERTARSAQQGRDRGKGFCRILNIREISRSNAGSVSDFRDQFYPRVKTEGWQRAVSTYAGTADIDEFYRLFEEFLGPPLKQQLDLLKTLKDGSR